MTKENVSFKTYGFKPNQGAKAQGMGYQEEIAPTLNTTMNAGVCIKILENHPNDSRVKIREDNTFQALTSRMGTGGVTCP